MFCFGVQVRFAADVNVQAGRAVWGYAEFDVRQDDREETYFVDFVLHGTVIKRLDRSFVPTSEGDAWWEIIHRQAKPSDIVALLPLLPSSPFWTGWTYSMFLAAIMAWQQGYYAGVRASVRHEAGNEVSRGEE